MNIEILDDLLREGEELSSTVIYVPAPSNVIRWYSVYKSSDSTRYQKWQSSAQRFVKNFYPSDVEDIKEACKNVSPNNHSRILGILEAIKLLPEEPKHHPDIETGSPSISITNNQTNNQQVTLNIFLDAIKDEITGRDLKVLRDILKDYEVKPEETKEKLIQKIKSFGGDVLSNIVANILTNPSIYSGLF